MVSTFTPNIQLEEPARGDDVGTWDTPVNSNMTLVDPAIGGIATIPLNNTPVVLATAQFQARMITFNSTLTGSVTISFPSSFTKSYEIQHLCTGSSAFVINLAVTGSSAVAGQTIAVPPGEICEVVNDGKNIKFKNFGRVGSYMDIATATVPIWVGNCSVPPYLNCDGSAFSAVTYPALAAMIGATVPDSRGGARFALDQATGRISSSLAFGTSSLGSLGGAQTTTLVGANLPPYTPTGTVSNTISGGIKAGTGLDAAVGTGANIGPLGNATITVTSTFVGNPVVGQISAPFSNVPPAYIGGLTLIRAA